MPVSITTGSARQDGVAQIVLSSQMVATGLGSDSVTIAPALSSVSNLLGGDVAITNGSQYYDGPAVTLGAGTWLLSGDVTLAASAVGRTFTVKLWDGTNAAIASATVLSHAAGNFQSSISAVVVVVAASTTFKISAKSSSTGDSIKASVGEGNTASIIAAVRIV